MLKILTIRPTIAMITVQNWKNISQVIYIGITSLDIEEGKRKNFDFLELNRESDRTPWYPLGNCQSRYHGYYITLFDVCQQ